MSNHVECELGTCTLTQIQIPVDPFSEPVNSRVYIISKCYTFANLHAWIYARYTVCGCSGKNSVSIAVGGVQYILDLFSIQAVFQL